MSGLAAVRGMSPTLPGTPRVILDAVEESFDGNLVVVGTFQGDSGVTTAAGVNVLLSIAAHN